MHNTRRGSAAVRVGFDPVKARLANIMPGDHIDKKGDSELTLPKLDVPIDVLRRDVFLPVCYRVKNFGGNVLAA